MIARTIVDEVIDVTACRPMRGSKGRLPSAYTLPTKGLRPAGSDAPARA